jgi:DNA modification methylase
MRDMPVDQLAAPHRQPISRRLLSMRMNPSRRGTGEDNRLRPEDRAVHDWYRFVLSFPPHLVRTYLDRFGIGSGDRVLDPFCGTGTTLVECKKLGIESIGLERNPMAYFASRTKLDWSIDPNELMDFARTMASDANARLRADGISDEAGAPLGAQGQSTRLRRLPEEANAILLKGSISPLPLHKVLVLLEAIEESRHVQFHHHAKLALARVIVNDASNLQFGPEVGVGPAKPDAAVIGPWLFAMRTIGDDLAELVRSQSAAAKVHLADSRELLGVIAPETIDAVITSPPYPNEKDYTRTTRLESVILGMVRNKSELQSLKHGLVRSNTRSIYSVDTDDQAIATHPEINRIANEIERRRIELGKTSGFERMYARVTKLYFGGMARHLASLRRVLKPDARLAYVVGDQASYLRVMIRTGEILADIACGLSYEVESIDLFRRRRATATREMLREEVVVLRWPGGPSRALVGPN